MKEVTVLKDAAKNLNMRKSTNTWVRVFENWCDENGLEKNPETVRPEQLVIAELSCAPQARAAEPHS